MLISDVLFTLITAQKGIGQLKKNKEKCHKHANISGVALRHWKTAGKNIRESVSLFGNEKKKRATKEKYKIITNMEDIEKMEIFTSFSHEP